MTLINASDDVANNIQLTPALKPAVLEFNGIV
jgi:hypothetical protein